MGELAKNTNIKVEIENNIIENSEENMVNGENTKIKVEEFKEEEFLEEEFKEEETELVETKTEETEINQSKGEGSIPELDKTPKDEMSKADDLEVENKDNVEKVSEGVMKVVDTVIEETLLEGTKLDTEDMNVAKKESDVTKVEKIILEETKVETEQVKEPEVTQEKNKENETIDTDKEKHNDGDGAGENKMEVKMAVIVDESKIQEVVADVA